MEPTNKKDLFKSTKQVLELIGLSYDEIDTYFHLTGRGPVMIGEIALLINVSDERATEIAKNLLEKGLVREVPGKTPFYVALPPYTALLNQITRFKEIVKQIRQSTPETLQLKFKEIEEQSAKLGKLGEYREYIQMMKTNLPNQIKSQFERVENELENVKKFQEIRAFIINLREIVPEEIVKEFSVVENRLEKIKLEISESFEKQFRIGALKSMAEKIVGKIISEQFHDLTDYFKEKFVKTIQNTLDQVTEQLGTISDAAGEMSVDLGATLTDIQTRLKETLEDLDSRISTVYKDVETGIDELKDLFQREIYDTLEKDIMKNIIDQLDLSEETMTEFWERSKTASMLTFKDVWFVRSVEGVRAQINEAVTRVKMRIHIIAPRIEDIDLVSLSNVKKHINVRISTNFDWNNPSHQGMLAQINQHPNFDIRHYPRENLWSINRDFEEVVVCVVSKSDTGEIEIAGMGSILEEHVKLFAAVLEDVWIQSKKIAGLEALIESIAPKTLEKRVKTPKEIKKEPSYIKRSTVQQPTTYVKPTVISQDDSRIEPLEQKPHIPTKQQASVQPSIEIPPEEKSSLSQQYDAIRNNINKKSGIELASDLERFRNDYVEERGYSSVLNQISVGIATLKTIPKILSSFEASDILKKLNFWKKKLNL
ncbi:MAG: helix-turn-helix domain-containing protein [Candidatus Hodarchaeota archaeon]